VKKELVAKKGTGLGISGVGSAVLGSNTLNVAQHPSNFSILNTGLVVSVTHLLIGIAQGVPFPQHVYNITGLVLHDIEVPLQPKNPLSHVSKQTSPQQLAFF